MGCSVCSRPDVADVNAELATGKPLSVVAAAFGLKKATLGRHSAKCVERPASPRPIPVRAEKRPPILRVVAKAKPAKVVPIRGEARDGETLSGETENAGTDARARETPRRHRTAPREVERTMLEERAVELRIAGKGYREIAAELGSTPGACQHAVERVLIRTRAGADERAEVARAVELARCDALMTSLWGRATDPNCAVVDVPADNEAGCRPYDGQDKAADRVVKIMERRAKLLGLDERTKVDVTSDGRAIGFPADHPLAALGRDPTIEELRAYVERDEVPQPN